MTETAEPTASRDGAADALIARARALRPVLRERRAEVEASARIPPASMDAIRDAGLFGVLQPRTQGGVAHGLDAFVRIAAELAAGCGATGWAYAHLARTGCLSGLFGEEAQQDIRRDDADALIAAAPATVGRAVAEGDGFRLGGTWPFAGGAGLCGWLVLGAHIGGTDGEAGLVLVPAADCAIAPESRALGLAGAGTRTVTVGDAFVPARRMLSREDAKAALPAAMDFGPVAAAIGMAQGALDDYVEGARVRVTRGAAVSAPRSVAEFQSIQLRVAEAAAGIDAARALVLRDCADIAAAGADGTEIAADMRARIAENRDFAVGLSVRATDLLFESVGGMGLYSHNDVQRAWRDVRSAARLIAAERGKPGVIQA